MSNKKKTIAYISGTRADFGLMTPILKAIEKSSGLKLQLYVTGMHLMDEFGSTWKVVKKVFPDVKKIEATFDDNGANGQAKFIAEFLPKVINTLLLNKPDFVLILGDRVEMLCVALACLYLGLPSGQVHGGERTSTVDEIARHAITKLTNLHFAATSDAADRIKRLGEEDWRIHVVGTPALDVILNEELPTKEELVGKLGIDPDKKIILVLQHPVSEDYTNSARQMKETIEAVKSFNLPAVIVYPNSDPGSQDIIKVIEKERTNPLFHIFKNIEHKFFLALERECVVWVGNSSAALIESASFQVPVVNIGNRQKDRLRGENVINVEYDSRKIRYAVVKSLKDKKYLAKLKRIKNPWGDGKTGPRLASILERVEMNAKLLTKHITY